MSAPSVIARPFRVSETLVFSLLAALGADYEQYRVPDTGIRLLLSYQHDLPIEETAMQQTLLQTRLRLRQYIRSHWKLDDEALFAYDDPYTSGPDLRGCFFGINHYPDGPIDPRHLTYRMVENVLKGLWDFVYRRGKYVTVHLLVKDDELGVVGIAALTETRPGAKTARMSFDLKL